MPRRCDTFRYDPGLPGHNEGFEAGATVGPGPGQSFLVDGRAATRLLGDGLVYDTSPFLEAVNLIGRPIAELAISLEVPDTDLRVQLFEVRQDGSYVFLCQDQMRAQYRYDDRHTVLVRPGEVDVYRFDRFPFVARTIAGGSTLRLVISPLGASVHQQRNRNSGDVVADETARDNRVASISVLVGSTASWVEIPLG